MWSLILYFLFGIGQPSNTQPDNSHPTVQTARDGDGGDKGNTVPPLPTRP